MNSVSAENQPAQTVPAGTTAPAEEDAVMPGPFDPVLAASVGDLRRAVEGTTSWDLATFVHLAGIYESAADAVHSVIDRADSWCETLEPEVVEEVLEDLDVITELLLAAEHDEMLVEETFLAARRERPAEPGDDRLVTVGLRVDPIRFHLPSSHLLPMLLRQIAGGRFDGNHRMLTVPVWLRRRLETLVPWTGIHLVGVVDEVPDGDILAVANSLWEPREVCDYQSPITVLEAARRLVE